MNPTENREIWQVDVGGQIYEANFDELTQWVWDGSLLPQDMVKRGNLRWIEAQKVPALLRFFNAKDAGEPAPVTTTTTTAAPFSAAPISFVNKTPADQSVPVEPAAAAAVTEPMVTAPIASPGELATVCSMHPDRGASYFCETCANVFCTACPKSYGGTVKICPFCGAMCRSVKEFETTVQATQQFDADLSQGFGFGDFVTALGYPLRYKSSYFFGGLMFMFFTLGQSAGALGGLMVAAGALICMMLSNMLTFGILSNVIENFAQGKVGGNFMPNFDEFSVWDSVVHPFLLSIAVYVVSFGLVIAIVVGSIFWGMNQLQENVAKIPEADQMRLLTDSNSPIRKNPAFEKQQNLYGNGGVPDEKAISNSQNFDEEKYFNDLNNTINETRKAQLESGIGKSPETMRAEQQKMFEGFAKAALPIVLLILLGMLWGIFYFPAACCVAGYTGSFAATLNPLIGLETIKILGFDYVKAWFMTIALTVMWFVAAVVIGALLAPFDLPRFGNLAATAVASWVVFYLAISFAVLLGLMLYKNSPRLKLFRA